ncbi:hypothetical protein F2Q68_00027764 [Brassica cretica]|uniref:Uncharacterized protein n=1 Tax=Brassica cretica TaxID=69181 RepID=A0A8S9ID39_BRACR|nr:hypothetical protein F2Q68_00027764 [Brassica cretica]
MSKSPKHYLYVESSDLIAYGLIPEFVGRFPVLVSLSALTENQLMQVKIDFDINIIAILKIIGTHLESNTRRRCIR